MVDKFEALINEYATWCKTQGLPFISADELVVEDITSAQELWLNNFISRWEAVERA